MGLDKLLDFILQFLADILPWHVTKVYEQSVMLRFGRVHRVVGPGICWKIPFVDRPEVNVTVTTTIATPVQTLYTSDEKMVTVAAVVKYSIKDVVKYVTTIYDEADAISDLAQGQIMQAVNGTTMYDCRDLNTMSQAMTKRLRAEVRKYGIDVETITLTNLVETRNYRVFKDE